MNQKNITVSYYSQQVISVGDGSSHLIFLNHNDPLEQ